MRAALPDKEITDFTFCWRDGCNLLALVNFCRPGLVPDLVSVDPANALENAQQAMKLAEENFFIPQLMSPSDLTVEKPDERSVMTYLSYFGNRKSPGQKALFLWIREQLPDGVVVTNFNTDWVNGIALGGLVNAVSSGKFQEYEQFQQTTKESGLENCQQSLEAAQSLLGVKKTVTPEEFTDPDLNSLQRTAYLLQFYYATLKADVLDVRYPEEPGAGKFMWVDIYYPGGSLSLIKGYAKGAVVGELETDIELLGNNKYRISFETEQGDQYTLSVTVGGIRIERSPFVFDLSPSNPQAVEQKNSILPKKVGIPAILLFDTSKAGKGELTAEASGTASGSIPISVDSTSPTSCQVSFIPMQSDTYTLTIKFDGQEVKGSPFTIPLETLVHPEMVAIGKPVIDEPGVPVTTPVDLSKAGEAELKVKCIGDKSGEIEATVLSVDKDIEITFIPPIEDVYFLSVFFDQTEVVGSPLQIDLYPSPPDSKKVRLTEPPSGALDPGAKIKIGFDTAEAGKGEMTVSCTGKSIGEVPIEVKQASKHKYEVCFTPPSEDVYSINVLWSDSPVVGSPFKLNLIPKDHPDPTKCKLLNFPKKSDILLTEEEIKFQVDATDAGKGTLEVMIDTKETSDKVGDPESAAGIEDKAGENEDKQETETTDGEPVASAEGATGEERPTQEEKDVTTPQEERDKTPSQEEKDKTPPQEEHKLPNPQVKKNSDNPALYDISYVPSQGGSHTVNILWANEHVPNSPFNMDIVSPQVAYVGSPVIVHLKTIYKRKHLKAYAISKNGGSHLKVKMDKIASGDYKLIFKPSELGVYLMHVSTKDKPINGSPFIIRYVESSNPAAIKVSGLKGEAVVGEPVEFVIDAKDAGIGDITVAPLGSIFTQDSALTTRDMDVRSIYLHNNRDGTYSAVFTPESAGDTSLDIRFGGNTVPGSPFAVSVLTRNKEEAVAAAEADPGKQKKKGKKEKKSKTTSGSAIFGLNLGEERFLVGTAHKFKIHCEDLGEGNLEVLSKPSSAADIDVNHMPDENSYWVEIMPRKPGKHDILVKFEGKHILGSPFRLTYLSRGEANKCMLIDTPKECQKEMENRVSFCISTKNSGKGKITATIKSLSSKTEVPCVVERPSKNHYHVVFSPTEGLNYMMSVKYDEIHIHGSPYKIALGDASLCRTEGEGLEQAWSSRWNKFRLDVEDAGPGELSVNIEGEDLEEFEGSEIEQNISSIDENHYEVAYQPVYPGRYWITVKWGKVNIPGSPFDINCRRPLEPSQFTVDSVLLVHHEKPAHLAVTCDALIEESDKMTVSIHSDQEEKFPGEVERNSGDRSYTCTICPPQLGKYFVYVLWDGKHVVGSPFEITNVPPPTLNDFQVEAVEADEGVIAVKLTGPRYAFRYGNLTAAVRHCTEVETPEEVTVTITKLTDEESNVQFKPVHGGEYFLGLQYDDQHIVGSPFKLLSTDAAQCYARGTGVVRAQTNDWNKFTVFTENGGPGDIRVEIEGEAEGEGDILLNALVTAASETRYDVSYFPTAVGSYRISVFWDIQHIPGSPFDVFCCDPKRYSIPKRPKEGSLGKPIKVGVKESTPAPKLEKLEVYANTKDHSKYLGEIKKGSDGGYICTVLPPELGKYLIHLQCNGFEINQSPFKVKNFPVPIPEKVKAQGPGLVNGTVDQKGNFNIDVADAGHGYLSLKVQGPKDGFKINLHHSSEDADKIVAEYNPTHPGSYTISVLWSGTHIPNSPFNVSIADASPEPAVSMAQLEDTE